MRNRPRKDSLDPGLVPGLIVRVDNGRQYFTIKCDFVTVNPRNEIRNGLYTWTNDLEIRCQGNQDDTAPSRQLYGFEVEYKPHSVDLSRAGQMYRTLLKIYKGLEKLDKARGYNAGYGEYVHRIAEILKVKWIIQIVKPAGNYDDGEYRFMTPAQGRNYIAGLEQQWLAQKQENAS